MLAAAGVDTATAVALVLIAVALLVVPDRLRIPVKVGRLFGGGGSAAGPSGDVAGIVVGAPSDGDGDWGAGGRRRSSGRRAWLLAGGLGAATALVVPDLWWLALAVSVIVGVVLSRRTSRRSPDRRLADRRRLAVHEDLLASCLDAGMAVAPALRAVAQALSRSGSPDAANDPGGGGDRGRDGPIAALDAVAAMLALGADPESAWQHAEADPDLVQLAAAARRSASGGAGFADAVREHAAALRADSAAESVRAAGRAGVLMTAPLGVCFLPAFVCWGLAPVVVGLIGQLDIF